MIRTRRASATWIPPIRQDHASKSERVAQAVEHVTFNHGVEGSSPSALTNEFNTLRQIWDAFVALIIWLCTHVAHTSTAETDSIGLVVTLIVLAVFGIFVWRRRKC